MITLNLDTFIAGFVSCLLLQFIALVVYSVVQSVKKKRKANVVKFPRDKNK